MTKDTEMQALSNAVKNCKNCSLYKTRKNAVVGAGSLDAKILFIGEAPGRNEDIQGIPFVGRAGNILDELLDSIALKRDDIYIANILKCRPPDNRNPLKSEIDVCTRYLESQIEIIQPKIICPLGNFAASYILEKYGIESDKISRTHGRLFNVNTLYGKIRIIPLYHPAVATYNPNSKGGLLEGFKTIKRAIE